MGKCSTDWSSLIPLIYGTHLSLATRYPFFLYSLSSVTLISVRTEKQRRAWLPAATTHWACVCGPTVATRPANVHGPVQQRALTAAAHRLEMGGRRCQWEEKRKKMLFVLLSLRDWGGVLREISFSERGLERRSAGGWFFFVFNPLFEGRLQSPLLLVIGKRGLHLVNLVEMLLQS